MVNEVIIKCMGREFIYEKMEENMMENFLMIKNMDMENIYIVMEENILVNGT